MKHFDLVIIGAGPAGLSAASLAVKHGATVAILDEQATAGGQIYRNVAQADVARLDILGADYQDGQSLVQNLTGSEVTHLCNAVVWGVTLDGVVSYSIGDEGGQIAGRKLLIATGALERPMPIPGWTLPGVMTAGAAQILMKSSGLVPENAILVGSGPLIYLLASQMIAAGAPPKALVETQTRRNMIAGMRHISGAVRGWKAIAKGVRMLGKIRAAGVPRYTGAHGLRVLGEEHAKGIAFQSKDQQHELESTTVLLHQGVVPNTQITRSLQLDHRWDDQQRCFHPVLDHWGKSSSDTIFVAGDGAGIGGAKAAEYAGRISAAEILCSLGIIDQKQRDQISDSSKKALATERAVRPFLDALYPPSQEVLTPSDEVIVCRCEAVRAGDIRRYAKLGCTGPNQTKAFGRSGMGPCQGRYCGLTVTELLAAEHGKPQDEIGSYRIRMPIKPVTLGQLASINQPK